jgi:Holliday junction resolvasome RuvABC DNA-binding subunit
MRASDLLDPEQLPVGAHAALQELVGTAALTVRALGNALKRVQDKRIEGIPRKLTRTIDNHGFAIWQVVNALDETSTTSERPRNAELLRGALMGMGYSSAEANYAITALRARIEIDPLATLVREALGVLAQRPVTGSKAKRR